MALVKDNVFYRPAKDSTRKLRAIVGGSHRKTNSGPFSFEQKARRQWFSPNVSANHKPDVTRNQSVTLIHVAQELKLLRKTFGTKPNSTNNSRETAHNSSVDGSGRKQLPLLKRKLHDIQDISQDYNDNHIDDQRDIKKQYSNSTENRSPKHLKRQHSNKLTDLVNPNKKETIGFLRHSKDNELYRKSFLMTRLKWGTGTPFFKKPSQIQYEIGTSQNPIRNPYNSDDHLALCESQVVSYLKRTKKNGWVKYPSNVIIPGMNYFDYYLTIKSPNRILKIESSMLEINDDQSESVDLDEQRKKEDIEKEQERKINRRRDLRVAKEQDSREQIQKANREKTKRDKVASLKELNTLKNKHFFGPTESKPDVGTEYTEPVIQQTEEEASSLLTASQKSNDIKSEPDELFSPTGVRKK